MNEEGRQLVQAVHVVSEHMAEQIGDPNLAASWDAVLRFLHVEIEIPVGRPLQHAAASSSDDLKLALRVEAAVARLDARLGGSKAWQDAVHEWRTCVRVFGAASASASGALLAVLGVAMGWPAIEPDIAIVEKLETVA